MFTDKCSDYESFLTRSEWPIKMLRGEYFYEMSQVISRCYICVGINVHIFVFVSLAILNMMRKHVSNQVCIFSK